MQSIFLTLATLRDIPGSSVPFKGLLHLFWESLRCASGELMNKTLELTPGIFHFPTPAQSSLSDNYTIAEG